VPGERLPVRGRERIDRHSADRIAHACARAEMTVVIVLISRRVAAWRRGMRSMPGALVPGPWRL
jgi:hypothetical protein